MEKTFLRGLLPGDGSAADGLQQAERLLVSLAAYPARRSRRCCLRQGLVDDRPQGCNTTPAIRTAPETFIDRAWRSRTHPAGHDIPDFCVGQDIAGANDHSGTGGRGKRRMCQRFSNPLSNNTQDKNRRLQMFQNKIATIRSLDWLKIIVERKTETWPFSTDRQADKGLHRRKWRARTCDASLKPSNHT
jgi:hypothetical protein